MNSQLLEYRRTNHFLFNQWNRNIDDSILHKVLPYINCSKCEKDVIIVMPSFLKKKGVEKDDETCLILIAKKNLIVTGFWCDHPNYLFKKEKSSDFQIIYK